MYDKMHDRLAELEGEIELLKAQVTELRQATDYDRERVVDAIVYIYRYLGDLRSYVMPLLHQQFPKIGDCQKQIDKIIGSFARRSKDAPKR